MRALDLLHRWLGAFLGLLLAVLGLSGAILVHKDEWIALPHASDARLADPGALGRLTQKLTTASREGDSVVFASDRFGLVQVRRSDGGGLYADQTGAVVTTWQDQWSRPELWLFDLHHHLFAGDSGEIIVGIAGLAMLLFAVSGAVLWWRTRRTFRLRALPRRLSGPAIRMHHRDLGIVAAPLLFLTALTGVMMIFRPVAGFVLAPLSPPSALDAALAAPKLQSGALSASVDWARIVRTAHQRFPDAQLRIIGLPKAAGAPITVRMKRAAEWLPNGRTTLWFDASDGRLLASRDALKLPAGAQAFNAAYPLHAAKVGGLPYRIVMTLCGLALTLLGTLAVWSFGLKQLSTARPVRQVTGARSSTSAADNPL